MGKKPNQEEEEEERNTPRGEQEDWKKDAKERLHEGGPKAANRERRYELVERLEDAQKKAEGGPASAHFLEPSWEVAFRHEKKTVKFEWWSEDKAKADGVY